MATSETTGRRFRPGCRTFLIAGGLIIVALVVTGIFFLRGRQATGSDELPDGWQIITAERGNIEASVDATGDVEPVLQANLNFAVNGTISEVLVQSGDQVEAGQPLVRIDDADLQLSLEKIRADLLQAQADYQELLEGATPAEIAEAQARVARTQSQYQQRATSVTQADIDAAQASLEEAQARLSRLQGGPDQRDLTEAQASVERAEASLAESRTRLASAKERARLDIDTAANELRNVQEEYSRVYWENREKENALARGGDELPQEDKDNEAAALRAVQDSEKNLEQRRIAYEEAREEEITTIRQQEADLAEARANLDDVLAGAEAEDLANARAEVQNAQAQINELLGASRQNELAAEQASVVESQAQLDKLLADPSASALARAEATVASAEVAVREAERDIEQATLVAPFQGTVTRVNVQIGERTDATSASTTDSSSSAAITLADLTALHIDVPVDELDVAQIDVGQSARITLDALPESEVRGTVTHIAPLADKSDQGTTTYEVTIDIDTGDAPIRAGMTAIVEIITLSKDDVVVVPRRVVQTENGQSFVLIPTEGESPAPNQPASERREVTLGLSDREFVEITSGLEPGEEVLIQDVVNTFNPFEQ